MKKANLAILLLLSLTCCMTNKNIKNDDKNFKANTQIEDNVIEIDKKDIIEKINSWIDLWKIKKIDDFKNSINDNYDFNFVYLLNAKEISNNLFISDFFEFIINNKDLKSVWNEIYYTQLFTRNFNIDGNVAQVVCDFIFSRPETSSDTYLINLDIKLKKFESTWEITYVKFLPNFDHKIYKIRNLDFNKINYQSTLGIPIFTNEEEYYELKDYSLFRIENYEELKEFYLLLDYILNSNSNYEKNMLKDILSRVNYEKKSTLIVFSPRTKKIFIDQPYFIDDKNTLFFELTKNGPTNGYHENKNVYYYYTRYLLINKNYNPKIIIKNYDKDIILTNNKTQ